VPRTVSSPNTRISPLFCRGLPSRILMQTCPFANHAPIGAWTRCFCAFSCSIFLLSSASLIACLPSGSRVKCGQVARPSQNAICAIDCYLRRHSFGEERSVLCCPIKNVYPPLSECEIQSFYTIAHFVELDVEERSPRGGYDERTRVSCEAADSGLLLFSRR
jgi:hypothetical protein